MFAIFPGAATSFDHVCWPRSTKLKLSGNHAATVPRQLGWPRIDSPFLEDSSLSNLCEGSFLILLPRTNRFGARYRKPLDERCENSGALLRCVAVAPE